MKTAVIVNRMAHKGSAARRWPAIKVELEKRLGPLEPSFTEAPGHATSLARAALAEGVRRFVAVGGDGTVNETLNGLLDSSGKLNAPRRGALPGAGRHSQRACRALGYLAQPELAYDAAAATGRQAIDLLRVRCRGLDGRVDGALRLSDRFARRRCVDQPSHVAVALGEEARRDRLPADDARGHSGFSQQGASQLPWMVSIWGQEGVCSRRWWPTPRTAVAA